jgi:hypothetical protein
MSGISEWILRDQCGRREEFVPDGAPITASLPPVGVDARVNAVDPPAASTIQSETTIAVNENTGVLCSAFNDSYHWGLGDGISGFSRSVDGGVTWQDGGFFPHDPGWFSWGDPSVVWRRSDGLFYFTSMIGDSDQRFGLGLWRSADDCATFEWVGSYHDGDDDKELMAVDNNPGSPYYGRFYVAWTDLISPRRISLMHSDDGDTWAGPVDLNTPGESAFGAWPAVAPNGDLYVIWMHWVIYDTTISVEGVRSTDGGNTFFPIADPLTNAVAPRDLQATINCGRPALKANPGDGIRYFTLPQIAVGPDSCLHVVYTYDPDGYNTGDVIDSYYRRSCDAGASWEPEVRLNDDDTLNDQFFPAIAVNADNVVTASWYDRRLDPENYLQDRFWTISYDGGTTWEPNERITDQSSPIYTSSCYHGDYDQLATLDGEIYHIWSDDRIFFNGHYDPDVWFDRATLVPDFTFGIEPDVHAVCRPNVVTSMVSVTPVEGYDEPVTLSDSGVPAGVETGLTVNPIDPLPGSSTYVITVTEGVTDGTYAWLVVGSSPTITHDVSVTLVVSSGVQGTDFAWLPVTPTAGQAVTLTAEATGTEPISFGWAFGDGAVGTGTVTTHTYASGGTYTAILTATNECGEEVVQHVLTVTDGPSQAFEVYLPTVSKAALGTTVGRTSR